MIADRPFSKGEFLCQYDGELIDHEEAKRRSANYSDEGNFQFYFEHNGKKLW